MLRFFEKHVSFKNGCGEHKYVYVRCYFEGEPKDGIYNNYKLKNCEVLQYDNSRKMEKIIKDDFER